MKKLFTPVKAPSIYSKTILSLFLLLLTNSFNLRATDLYWVGGTGNWSDYANHWSTTSGGTTFHTSPPGPNDDVYFDVNSFASFNDTVHFDVIVGYCNSFVWTGATNNPTFSCTFSSNEIRVNGSFVLCPLMRCEIGKITFLSSQSGNIIKSFDNLLSYNGFGPDVLFDNPSGGWELADDLNLIKANPSFRGDISIKQGIFQSKNFNIYCGVLVIGYSTSPPPICLLGSSIIDCEFFEIHSASVCDVDSTTLVAVAVISSITNISFGNINCISHVDADSCTFNFVRTTYFNGSANFVKKIFLGNLNNQPSSHPFVTQPNYFQNAVFDYNNSSAMNNNVYFDTLFFSQNVNSFTLQTLDTIFVNKAFIIESPFGQTNVLGGGATLSMSVGTVCLHNVALQNINATGGAQFFAGQGCTDAGGNSGWTFAPCTVTSDVWPGDANYDLTVNNFDVLNIGLAYGDTGAVRAGASNNFIAQPAIDWNGFFQTAVNKKHADCNGDGIVNDNDTVAIALNYGQNHPARLSNPDAQLLPSPSLYLEINPDSASLGDTVNVDVFLGTSTTPVDSIYGIAFTINFDTAYVDTTYMTFDYTGNWMGTPGVDLLTFQKTRFLDGAVDFALVRTDHQNIAGFGFLERIGIVVVDNIGARISTPFTLSNVRAITVSEYELTINTSGDSLSLDTTSSVGVNEIENLENMISVYPNPAKDKLTIHSGTIKMNGVEIYNSIGEMVVNQKINSNVFAVNVTNLQQEVYLIRCITEKGIINKRIVVAVKQ